MDPNHPFEQPFDEQGKPPVPGGENPAFFGAPGYQQAPLPLQQVPNAVPVLVLGIISLVFLFCYGFGLVFSIIALALSANGRRLYRNNPTLFQPSSYSLLKSGRICALISLFVCIFFIAFLVIAVIFGMLSDTGPNYY